MPELDGYGVMHILSRQAKTASIPFIFLTAKAEKEDFRQGILWVPTITLSNPLMMYYCCKP